MLIFNMNLLNVSGMTFSLWGFANFFFYNFLIYLFIYFHLILFVFLRAGRLYRLIIMFIQDSEMVINFYIPVGHVQGSIELCLSKKIPY